MTCNSVARIYTLGCILSLFVGISVEDIETALETKECREKDRLVTSYKDDLYSLVDAAIGQTLILRCRFCSEGYKEGPRNWFAIFATVYLSKPSQLDMNNDMSKNRLSVNHKHSLVISKFSREDVGFYHCVHYEDQSDDEEFNFLIDIVETVEVQHFERGSITDWSKYHDEYFLSVNSLFKDSVAEEFTYLREVLKINAELLTQWAPWGSCEACGRPQGEAIMKKTGFCRIKLNPLAAQSENISETDMYLYEAAAISCRSSRLLANFPDIFSYTSKIPYFILEDKCTATCNPDAEGGNKGWKVGKGKGFKYRKRIIMEEGSHATFICPESSLDNKVVWRRKGRVLKSGDTSDEHIIVDTFDNLYLVEVIKSTSGNFTCYVDSIQMQQIVVFVYSKSKLLTYEVGRYFLYLGFILFLSSFCYCGGLVISWSRRHLFKNYSELKEESSQKDYEEMEKLI